MEREAHGGRLEMDDLLSAFCVLNIRRMPSERPLVQDMGGGRLIKQAILAIVQERTTAPPPPRVNPTPILSPKPHHDVSVAERIDFMTVADCIARHIAVQQSITRAAALVDAVVECPICMDDDVASSEIVAVLHDDDAGRLHPRVCHTCATQLRQAPGSVCPFCRLPIGRA